MILSNLLIWWYHQMHHQNQSTKDVKTLFWRTERAIWLFKKHSIFLKKFLKRKTTEKLRWFKESRKAKVQN